MRLFAVAAGGRLAVAHAPLEGPGATVHALAFSPDGSALAAGDGAGSLRVGANLWVPESAFAQSNAVTSLAFAPNGRLLVSGDAQPAASKGPPPRPPRPSPAAAPPEAAGVGTDTGGSGGGQGRACASDTRLR